ncbi:kelch-like protein 10 [Xenentodon cancila]
MMRLIINYAYTSTVPVTEDNVMVVMGAADQFLVPGMMQACCSFLEKQLCLRNCVGIWRLVDFYHCPEFKSKVFLYILHHFEEIVSISQEFLDLFKHHLAAFLESDHLSVKGENVGGTFNGACLRSAEPYNRLTNRWTGVPSMHSCCCDFGIEVVDDQLFVVGGFNSSAAISTAEHYDEEAGMWYHVSNL